MHTKKHIHAQYRGGQAVLLAVLLFVGAALFVVAGIAVPVLEERQGAVTLQKSIQSSVSSEAGVEDVAYRLIRGLSVDSSETLALNGATSTTVRVSGANTEEVTATGNSASFIRKSKIVLSEGEGASFNYGMQVGVGGVTFSNSPTVNGNLYSNGPISLQSNSVTINGSAVSAGPSGSIFSYWGAKPDITGDAHAHSLSDLDVGGNAYYTTIARVTVGGASYPGSPDQPLLPMPIEDATIEEWKTAAAAGGSVTCSGGSYNIQNTVTMGPRKIPCDLNVTNNAILYLTGPIWVEGNISLSNSAQIRIHSSVGGASVAFIADKPSNRTSSSRIFVSNSVAFQGSGTAGSYVLLASMNNSAESGGSTSAIQASNSVSGDVILYAPHGYIPLSNSVNVVEVTAYEIQATNSITIDYETGAASLLFTAGPSGSYDIQSWKEVE